MSPTPLTITIPTRNRYPFLFRLLRYYARAGCRFPILIGDASDEAQQVEAAIRQAAGPLRVIHHLCPNAERRPGLGTITAMRDVLMQVETPYAVFVADDDFVTPGALEEAVKFLEGHPDYSVVHGRAVLVALAEGASGAVRWTEPYRQHALEQPSAAARLNSLLSNYTPNEYSVKRTAAMREQWQATCSLELTNHLDGELLRSCLSVIEGKAKRLDRLYMVRQVHSRMTSLDGHDLFDRLLDASWPTQQHRMLETLARALAQHDHLELMAARAAVKQSFWDHLVKGLAQQWRERYESARLEGPFYIRDLVRGVPGARSWWRRIRSIAPPHRRDVSLRALLRDASPYHQDFMPIYRTLTSTAEPG